MQLVNYELTGIRKNMPMYVLTTYISNILKARTSVGRLIPSLGTAPDEF